MKLANGSSVPALLGALVAAALTSGCGEKTSLPKDPRLETFIATSAKSVAVDRAYSHDPELAKEELARIEFPADWKNLVDGLIAAHGSDPALWCDVYTQIVERSRR